MGRGQARVNPSGGRTYPATQRKQGGQRGGGGGLSEVPFPPCPVCFPAALPRPAGPRAAQSKCSGRAGGRGARAALGAQRARPTGPCAASRGGNERSVCGPPPPTPVSPRACLRRVCPWSRLGRASKHPRGESSLFHIPDAEGAPGPEAEGRAL